MPAAMIRALTELPVTGALAGLAVSIGTRVRYHSRAGCGHHVPRGILAISKIKRRVMSWLLCHAVRKGRRATAMIELLACPLAS